MSEEIRIPVKMLCYYDMIGTLFNKVVPSEYVDDTIMTLMLDGYMDITIAWAGTEFETMWYTGKNS